MKKLQFFSLFIFIGALTISCNEDSNNNGSASISPFSIVNDTTLSLNGVINNNTLNAFNEALRQNPNTKLLIFKEAPGSEDDETNLQVGRKLHSEGLNTHVENNGFIASGAVDLFLAGTKRTLGLSARVGVHSWSDGTNEATDFPQDAEEHQFFIKYYTDIGMSQQLAEDFYFFTINAAPAADVHWMTEAELDLYQIENP
ncbi:MAG: alpha/beta hydrolase [Bacteroidota bacterium]